MTSLRQLTAEGMPVDKRKRPHKYDTAECVRWYVQDRLKKAANPAGGRPTREAQGSRAELTAEQHRKLQLENDETERLLVRREDVVIVAQQQVATFLAMCDALASRIPSVVDPDDDAGTVRSKVKREVWAIRRQVAEGYERQLADPRPGAQQVADSPTDGRPDEPAEPDPEVQNLPVRRRVGRPKGRKDSKPRKPKEA